MSRANQSTISKLPSGVTAESYSGGPVERVDLEKAIIFGVKVCGVESLNGNRYPVAVLEKAKAKYDGASVYENQGFHQTGQISDLPTRCKMGVLQNPVVKQDGLYANFHYNPKHQFAEQFLWSVQNRPSDYGFSHVAHRTFRTEANGVRVAESINTVHRVDIVADPATTGGVFESVSTKGQPMTGREIAATINSVKDLNTFLIELFDGLPSGMFGDEEKTAAADSLWSHVAGPDEESAEAPTDPASEDAAVESIRKNGKLGAWAAGIVSESINSKRKADRIAKAKTACDAEKLPEHLRTDVFLDLVSESLGNDAKVKALIADRIANGKPAGQIPPKTGTDTASESKQPTTTPPAGGAGVAKVKDLVAGYKAGS